MSGLKDCEWHDEFYELDEFYEHEEFYEQLMNLINFMNLMKRTAYYLNIDKCIFKPCKEFL